MSFVPTKLNDYYFSKRMSAVGLIIMGATTATAAFLIVKLFKAKNLAKLNQTGRTLLKMFHMNLNKIFI